MLHRLSLRVLPQLNALVTDPPVRKRKRWVMLAPGLVAFLIYRLLKPVLPLSDPLVLLALSGSVSALAAVWAFRQGRGVSIRESVHLDGARLWVWLVGWTGFVYGAQLSLLVLAILQVFVGYDFLLHPEGPAMMAMIIPCTSATRDGFEIGHVQKLKHEEVPIPTFPDGQAFRDWLPKDFMMKIQWVGGAALLGVLSSWMVSHLSSPDWQPILQSLAVPAIVATLGVFAFAYGRSLLNSVESKEGKPSTWLSTLGFWAWPSLTFSVTYFLVMIGIASFILRTDSLSVAGFALIAGVTGVLMSSYTLFLGWRKAYEEKTVGIPENIQRCPFVMGMLQGTKSTEPLPPLPEVNMGHGDMVK